MVSFDATANDRPIRSMSETTNKIETIFTNIAQFLFRNENNSKSCLFENEREVNKNVKEESKIHRNHQKSSLFIYMLYIWSKQTRIISST